MVRKKIRNQATGLSEKLHKTELRVLFTIAGKSADELITQTKIAERLNIPLTSLNHHITKLRRRGLIMQTNELTEKGAKALRFFMKGDKEYKRFLRGHNIQVVLYIARLPPNFKEMGSLLQPFTNERYRGLKTELKGCKVLFYSSKKAVAVLPDIYGNNDEEIATALVVTVKQLIEALELEFNGLKVERYKQARFHSMHVAILDSVIAEAFIMKNQRIYSNGRIAVDNSHGRFELEAESVDTCLEDIEVLVKYEDLAKENERLKELLTELQGGTKSNG